MKILLQMTVESQTIKMVKLIVVFLAFAICLAQCASIHGKDKPNEHTHKKEERKDGRLKPSPHKRGKRSCHVCDYDESPPPFGPPGPPPPPLPPPPPPFFHSLQYTGLAKSNDGVPKGIFSGAAAAADFGNQAAGQAFSVASSSADTSGQSSGYGSQSAGQSGGVGGQSAGQSGSFSGQSAQRSNGYSSQSVGQTSGLGGQSSTNLGSQSSGNFGDESSANSQAQLGQSVDGNARGSGSGQNQFSGSGSFKEAHYSFHSDGSKHVEGHGAGGANGGFRDVSGNTGAAGHLATGNFGVDNGNAAGNSQSTSSAQGYGSESAGNEQQKEHIHVGFGHDQGSANYMSQGSDNQQQVQSAGTGHWQQGYKQGSNSSSGDGTLSSDAGSIAGSSTSSGAGYGSSNDSGSGNGYNADVIQASSQGQGQSTLNGALNLASQGLQASQQAGQAGCSTCGRSSYALSNAKSKSGNAVAVSIGG